MYSIVTWRMESSTRVENCNFTSVKPLHTGPFLDSFQKSPNLSALVWMSLSHGNIWRYTTCMLQNCHISWPTLVLLWSCSSYRLYFYLSLLTSVFAKLFCNLTIAHVCPCLCLLMLQCWIVICSALIAAHDCVLLISMCSVFTVINIPYLMIIVFNFFLDF